MEKRIINKWIVFYWTNMIILGIATLYLLLTLGIGGKSVTEEDFMYERFGIIFTLLFIPFALKFYNNRHQKFLTEDILIYIRKMSFFYYIRLVLIDFAIIFNLICFYYIGTMNFFYLALIGLCSFFLCYPSIDQSLKNEK